MEPLGFVQRRDSMALGAGDQGLEGAPPAPAATGVIADLLLNQ
jgi:hypothetical protein